MSKGAFPDQRGTWKAACRAEVGGVGREAFTNMQTTEAIGIVMTLTAAAKA